MAGNNEVRKSTDVVDAMADDWGLIHSLMGGTKAMRRAAKTYLPQWPAEDPASYNARLATATLFPAYARTISVLSGKPFSKPLTFGEDVPKKASSDPTRNGDNYTRMTSYLALTFAAAFGYVIGQPQTKDLRTEVEVLIDSFLWNLENKGMIGDVNGGPAFSVVIDASDNPDSQVALGYMQANVQVKYLSIVWFFLVNLEGGQTVPVHVVGAQPA